MYSTLQKGKNESKTNNTSTINVKTVVDDDTFDSLDWSFHGWLAGTVSTDDLEEQIINKACAKCVWTCS